MNPQSRKPTRSLKLGSVTIGGGAPVSVQSMCNTDTRDAAATLTQIRSLATLGCQIIRLAVPDMAAAEALREITAASPIPVVADIHFDYRLALASIAGKAAAIRLNPGNIGNADQIRQVAEAAGEAGIPIRVGANSGSVRPELLTAMSLPEALVHSALEQCRLLEQFDFHNIKVSLKASDVSATVAACRLFRERADYPQHIGVTESGTPARGIVKSSVGIGALLLDGIGDTLRVSLTAPPEQEVVTALRILEACGLRSAEPELVSCPTCGRTRIDLIGLAEKVESLINEIKSSGRKIRLHKIAVMGCVVNGPGEARDAEIGVAGGDRKLAIFHKGEIAGTYPEEEGFALLRAEILKHCDPAQ
ncbi:MAG: flavodoxin-dependent (E)-4-hydroxy-3-methylbut-2-enyl-diphosphate synthase [Lentisphaeria bacterium]|nr:flavodoxin-dependent (E)-4-hydroxy-3-methylbut-2-enyl-diphosphate synthase [Lentisphaeria bacterium]